MRAVVRELHVVLRFAVEAGGTAGSPVRGELQSLYGRDPFWGWLELLGQLEALVDRASIDQELEPGSGTDHGPGATGA